MDKLGELQLSNLYLFDIHQLSLSVALGVFVASFLLYRLLTRILVKRLKVIFDHDKAVLSERFITAVDKPLALTCLILGIYIATKIVLLPSELDQFVDRLLQALVTFNVFWILYRFIEPINHLLSSTTFSGLSLTEELRQLFTKVVKIVVGFLATIAFLQVWGVNVVAFLGGVGLVGMAVALAAQDTVKNFFGAVAIFGSQTFRKGNLVKIGDVEGNVINIGLRSTEIRQKDHSIAIIPNSTIVNTNVINYASRSYRRVEWVLLLDNKTSNEMLERTIQKIRDFFEEEEEIQTNPNLATTVVHFAGFKEDGSLEIFIQYFANTPVWKESLRIQEKCAYKLKSILEEEGISHFIGQTILLSGPEKTLLDKPEEG